MLKKQSFLGLMFFALCLPCLPALAASKTITLCTDANFWYPFTYVKNEQATGLHIDIINQALSPLNYVAEYKPMGWSECQEAARRGKVDGIVTIAYEDNRAQYLYFPKNAERDHKSPWRVTQADYVLITTNNPAQRRHALSDPLGVGFTAQNFKTLPLPVRVTASYSIVNDFNLQGVPVSQNVNTEDNYKKLVQEQTGSIIDLTEVALHYGTQPEYSGRLFIHPQPLQSKSYYLAFSKQGRVSQEDAQLIWQRIADVRDNKTELGILLEKY